jgi:tRNA(Ile)-lysidine synthase
VVQVHPPLPRPLSPTAITRPDALDRALGRALDREAPAAGERWLVAFSGGPDSTALATALAPLAGRQGLRITLGHVDHGSDEGSARRAELARELAARLALDFRLTTIDVAAGRARRESPEAAARRLRYAALEVLRRELGATRVLTAHHRHDQVETVLLKLLRGAVIERLGGIAERRGTLLRPLLDVPRSAIEARFARADLKPVRDPTNDDLSRPRNRLRHLLLPRLRAHEPGLDAALLALAARADALRLQLGHLFQRHFRLETTAKTSIEGKGGDSIGAAAERPQLSGSHPTTLDVWKGAPGDGDDDVAVSTGEVSSSIEIQPLTSLPRALQLPALRWLLTERLRIVHLPSLPSMEAFLSLSNRGREASLRLPGDSRALVARRGWLALGAPEPRVAPFAYTFRIPGEVELPELGLRLRVRRSPVEPWMRRGERARTGLVAEAAEATVRSRRSGDRVRPLGSPGSRKLKAVLIDRGVPAAARDRLPLLEIAGELAWIPGVTIGDGFALAGEAECWLAELEPLAASAAGGAREGERKTTT